MNAIIYSGGMDSTVLLNEYKDISLAINFNYGSKHNLREREYARLNCQRLGIELLEIDIDFNKLGISSNLLISGGEIPEGHYQDETMKQTVVPFRNGIMLSMAASIAESKGLKGIYIANHAGDHTIYPDCRPEFIINISKAIQTGTYAKIKVLSPFLNLSKREIALIGKENGTKFNQTYSCYRGEERHCGVCGTCIERKEALKGFDETEYECII